MKRGYGIWDEVTHRQEIERLFREAAQEVQEELDQMGREKARRIADPRTRHLDPPLHPGVDPFGPLNYQRR